LRDLFELAKRRQKGGFGVQIMRRLMDNVLYVQHGKKNEVRLMKYRTSSNPRQNGNPR
jgi:anti-sigma regulatory factor (Ser/Thr protein kinase)